MVGDALGDLLNSLIELLNGGGAARCAWEQEPGRWIWEFLRLNVTDVRLRLISTGMHTDPCRPISILRRRRRQFSRWLGSSRPSRPARGAVWIRPVRRATCSSGASTRSRCCSSNARNLGGYGPTAPLYEPGGE